MTLNTQCQASLSCHQPAASRGPGKFLQELGDKNPEGEIPGSGTCSLPAAQSSSSFPKACREHISCTRIPSYLPGKVMSCFLGNVQFWRQNEYSNSHAVQVKWEVFKCGASCLQGGKGANMNIHMVLPLPFYYPGAMTMLGHDCLPPAAYHTATTKILSRERTSEKQWPWADLWSEWAKRNGCLCKAPGDLIHSRTPQHYAASDLIK